MSDYSKLTNFATKDSLASGNPLKVIKGTEIDDEFEAIETSVATKANLASPTFTGTPAAPTAAATTNSTQVATTAFVKTVITSGGYVETAGIADNAITLAKMADDSVGAAELVDNSVGADALNVSGDGTAGQVLKSDGDGSFTWVDQNETDIEASQVAGSTSTTVSLAAGTWMVQAHFTYHQDTVGGGSLTIDGTTVCSSPSLGDSQGTTQDVLFGYKEITVASTTTITVSGSTGNLSGSSSPKLMVMAWKTA